MKEFTKLEEGKPFISQVQPDPLKPGVFFWERDTEQGRVIFTVADLKRSTGELSVELQVEVEIEGSAYDTFESRINLLSLSGKDQVARALRKTLTKEINWDALLNRLTTDLKDFHDNSVEEVELAVVETDKKERWLFDPFLVYGAPNIIFGKGGTGKSFLSLSIASAFVTGDFVGHKPDKTVNVLFVDYEDSAEEAARRIRSLNDGKSPSNIWYFNPGGVPIRDLKKPLQRIIARRGIELLLIDSAALACGGKPEDADTAIRFFNALSQLNITSLIIAHETKSEEGKYPFGSVFFWNSPRCIWYVKGEQEQDDRAKTIGLFNRKSSHGLIKSPIGIRMWFGADGHVEVKRGSLSPEWANELTVKKRIMQALREGPMDLDELVDKIDGVKKDQIKNRLSDLKKQGWVNNIEGWWTLLKKGGGTANDK